MNCLHCKTDINDYKRVSKTCGNCGKPYDNKIEIIAKFSDFENIPLQNSSSFGYGAMYHFERQMKNSLFNDYKTYISKNGEVYRILNSGVYENMKLNEFDDVKYYREEIEKAGLPVSKLGAKLKIRGEDGETKWLHVNADSIKALNSWFKNTKIKDKMMKTDKTKKIVKESYDDANFFDFIERDAGMRHEALEYMKGYIDADSLLTELIYALDDDTALDCLGYIARNNDIPKPDEEVEPFMDSDEIEEVSEFGLKESSKKKVTPKKIVNEETEILKPFGVFVYLYANDSVVEDDLEYYDTKEEAVNKAKKTANSYGNDYYVEVWKKDKDGLFGNSGSAIWSNWKSNTNESLTENTITMDQFYTNMLK
jgi:hypothetical protein